MKLTPAQARTLWEMDRARMGDRTEDGRVGWLPMQRWHNTILRALQRRGLVEYKPRAPGAAYPPFMVRLTDAGADVARSGVPTPYSTPAERRRSGHTYEYDLAAWEAGGRVGAPPRPDR